ncbi:hypothetical protein CEXT_324891 [Caerostris extrusa]|uniref:Uncharacterized protein n=1 Tax=Caerostris extrusa TaxID=172846 RepID=A0AAV4MGT8_CAEEX|nr:hypothetical protein CEXT_324891 [Caerostris extrusa]
MNYVLPGGTGARCPDLRNHAGSWPHWEPADHLHRNQFQENENHQQRVSRISGNGGSTGGSHMRASQGKYYVLVILIFRLRCA